MNVAGAESPTGACTITSTGPSAWAGLATVIVVSFTTLNPTPGVPSKVTPVAPVKPLPVMVTGVPPVTGPLAGAREVIAGADLVIAALGYRPRALPVERVGGLPLRLAADEGKALVDRHCRVLDADGEAVPGLYGIGLAAGFVPWGKLGGEASFVGQANGLWLWQNDVGMMIVDQLIDLLTRDLFLRILANDITAGL